MALFAVHVTPRSSRNAVLGIENGEVRVKVTAPPDEGKANKAVCKLLASALGIPKSGVRVAGGQTSRHKRIEADLSSQQLDAWMDSLEALP